MEDTDPTTLEPTTPEPTTPEPTPWTPPASPSSGAPAPPAEIGGVPGPDPTRYGDWQHKGRVTDF